MFLKLAEWRDPIIQAFPRGQRPVGSKDFGKSVGNVWTASTIIFQLRGLKSQRCGKTWIKTTCPGNAGGGQMLKSISRISTFCVWLCDMSPDNWPVIKTSKQTTRTYPRHSRTSMLAAVYGIRKKCAGGTSLGLDNSAEERGRERASLSRPPPPPPRI